jgi:glyoxylate reductase
MKAKALVTHELLPDAMEFLARHVDFEIGTREVFLPKPVLLQKVRDKEGLLALLTVDIDRDVIEAAPRLVIIANCAVGTDNIDIDFARKKGILVTNTPGVLTETTADLAWALILAVARKIPQADRFLREGNYRGWKIDLCLGREITGKRLGIIGMGRIGKAVAERAKGFKMDIVYYDRRRLSADEEKAFGAIGLPLDELLRTSDIVSIHASMTEGSYHLLSGEKLDLMKRDAVLINVARGPIVDEQALADRLENGRLWGAGLDVYEREPTVEGKLLRLDNVVLLPHIGSATYETRLKMAMMAATNLVMALKGEKPPNPVS